jgi:hypothetical protein
MVMGRKTRKQILMERSEAKESKMSDVVYAIGAILVIALAILWLASAVFGMGWEFVAILQPTFFAVLVINVIVNLVKGTLS